MKDKNVAAVLALFLGWFGVHKFYLGRIGAGIVYLVFFWTMIPALLGMIDFFVLALMDNDEFNRGRMLIPSHAVFDLRIGGEIENFFWSFAVQNLFDRQYFDYGLDASFTFFGTTFDIFNLYPLPGRTYMLKAGLKW